MNDVINFLKDNKNFYNEYFINDRLKKCKYGYTCDINQIYCYLNKINISKTEYFKFFNLSLDYFDFNNKKILEVCCGKIPILSSIYKDYGYNITAIDNQLILNNYKDIKLYKADISNENLFKSSDIIVAIRPCDPIDTIIELCFKFKKSFMIYLCPCIHNSHNGKKFQSYNEWILYLKNKIYSNKNYKCDFLICSDFPDDCYIIIAKTIAS